MFLGENVDLSTINREEIRWSYAESHNDEVRPFSQAYQRTENKLGPFDGHT